MPKSDQPPQEERIEVHLTNAEKRILKEGAEEYQRLKAAGKLKPDPPLKLEPPGFKEDDAL